VTPAIQRATIQGSKGVRESWRLGCAMAGARAAAARGVAAGMGIGRLAGPAAGAWTREAVKVSTGSARSTIRNKQLTA